MDKKHKCKYCGALLSETNSVFVHISRFDDKGKSSKSHWMCCKCWDNTRIQVPYIKEDTEPENYHKCGNCKRLIFKNYRHNEGLCELTRLHRCFTDLCVHNEHINVKEDMIMLHRLWLTDEQAKTLRRAIRAHISTLYKCADEMHTDKAYDIEEKYINEANALDEILDIIDTED